MISNFKFQISNYTSLTDEELVVQILSHNKEALGELFRRYHKPLFNFAYRFLGNYESAQDVTSEVFLRIYRYLKSFDQTKKFKTWAYKIAANECLTQKVQSSLTGRAKFKVQSESVKLKIDEETEVDFKDEKVDLIKETEKSEISERVQAALQKLPEPYRLPLYLYYFQELKYEEIAETLNLPINTVRTRIKRGKERMRVELGDLIS